MIMLKIGTFKMVVISNFMMSQCTDVQGLYFVVSLSSVAVAEVLAV
jgi:hypothetical protein